jgi:Ca2+-binding EF-hand superfamily protein
MKNRSLTPCVALFGLTLVVAAGTSFAARDNPATNQPLPASTSSMRLTNENVNDHGKAAQAKFDQLDADHDGTIDKQEAMASEELTVRFDKLDIDHDGKLSPSEFSAIKDLASIKIDHRKGEHHQ